jgi:hypothetical protein
LPRPTIGVEKKTRINLRIDPTVWKTFQTLVEAKLPPKTAANSHIKTLIKPEIARFHGSNMPDAAKAALQHKLELFSLSVSL